MSVSWAQSSQRNWGACGPREERNLRHMSVHRRRWPACAPFSFVLGAKYSGHRVRQYEKIRNDHNPMDPESSSCVVNHGPSYFTVMSFVRQPLHRGRQGALTGGRAARWRPWLCTIEHRRRRRRCRWRSARQAARCFPGRDLSISLCVRITRVPSISPPSCTLNSLEATCLQICMFRQCRQFATSCIRLQAAQNDGNRILQVVQKRIQERLTTQSQASSITSSKAPS